MGKYTYITDIKEIVDEYESFIKGKSIFCTELLAMQMDELTNRRYIIGGKNASAKLVNLMISRMRFLWMITIVKHYQLDELDCLFYDIYHSLKKGYDGLKCNISKPRL